jgi:hypothetical protein
MRPLPDGKAKFTVEQASAAIRGRFDAKKRWDPAARDEWRPFLDTLRQWRDNLAARKVVQAEHFLFEEPRLLPPYTKSQVNAATNAASGLTDLFDETPNRDTVLDFAVAMVVRDDPRIGKCTRTQVAAVEAESWYRLRREAEATNWKLSLTRLRSVVNYRRQQVVKRDRPQKVGLPSAELKECATRDILSVLADRELVELAKEFCRGVQDGPLLLDFVYSDVTLREFAARHKTTSSKMWTRLNRVAKHVRRCIARLK